MRRGVRQGDTISPRLFNSTLRLALDSIEWTGEGIRIDGKQLCTLEYADDIVIMAKSKPELTRMLQKLIHASSAVGLEVHEKKTVLLSSCTTTRQPIIIGGKTFTFSDGARYLGSWISFPLDQTKELDQRIQAAWQSWSKISSALCHRLVSPNMRQRAFNACIMSVVLYGCECWTLRSSDKERLSIV